MPRMTMRARVSITSLAIRPRGAVGLVAALVSSGVALLTVGVSIPEYRASPFELALPAWLIAIAFVASLGIVGAAWISSSDRPAVAVGLAVATVGLLVPTWAGWTTPSADARAYALAVAPMALAGAAHVGLRWSPGTSTGAPLVAIYGFAAAAVLVQAAGYNPLTDPGCSRTCSGVEPLANGLLSGHAAYVLATTFTSAAGVIAVLGLIRPGPYRRSSMVPRAAILAVVILALPWIRHATTWTEAPSRIADLLPSVAAALLIGFAPLAAGITARQVRTEVRELVDDLAGARLPRHRRAGGHAREVQFAVPGDGRWVDVFGVEIEPAHDVARGVVISDASGPALRLGVASGDDPVEVAASLTPATMLAIQNLRLEAVSRARLADVRSSQRRIVEASDAERQRIERDLHDGAQQRLVSASFQLSLARARLISGDEHLSRAEAAVREALAHLRELGHGIFPATLATHGLTAALEDLARASEVPVTFDVPQLDLQRDVALAAYAVVATVLAHARRAPGSPSASIVVTVDGGTAHFRLRLLGCPAMEQTDLTDLADRVGAVGGRFVVGSIEDGVLLSAEMPCE